MSTAFAEKLDAFRTAVFQRAINIRPVVSEEDYIAASARDDAQTDAYNALLAAFSTLERDAKRLEVIQCWLFTPEVNFQDRWITAPDGSSATARSYAQADVEASTLYELADKLAALATLPAETGK